MFLNLFETNVSKNCIFLRFRRSLNGLESSGRPIGTISTYFRPNPPEGLRAMTQNTPNKFSGACAVHSSAPCRAVAWKKLVLPEARGDQPPKVSISTRDQCFSNIRHFLLSFNQSAEACRYHFGRPSKMKVNTGAYSRCEFLDQLSSHREI